MMMSEMIEVKTAELIGPALDWAVAKADGVSIRLLSKDNPQEKWQVQKQWRMDGPYWPSQDWSQCGPLIAKHRVSIIYSDEVCNPCAWTDSTADWHAETPIIAACRAIVAAKLGDTVQVPKELIQ